MQRSARNHHPAIAASNSGQPARPNQSSLGVTEETFGRQGARDMRSHCVGLSSIRQGVNHQNSLE